MGKRIGVALLIVMLLTLGGLAINWISQARYKAAAKDCQWSLRSIASVVVPHPDDDGFYLPAVTRHSTLPPEKRISWLIDALWYFRGGSDPWWPVFELDKSWDDEANYPVQKRNRKGVFRRTEPGSYNIFNCPANPEPHKANESDFTNYVGISGVGEDAASLPLSDPRAGFFGYERRITPDNLNDGASTTIIITETLRDNGKWFQGGPATVRGLLPNSIPYFGDDGQFSSRHWAPGGFLNFGRRSASNFAFADGSVRLISDSISPHVLEALATIAGGDEVLTSEF